eukprot:CAMPEP_0203878040 /NCGR_PEP_ID=MMETSP0359-20131031/22601_1 /ASSEMBLY_ACC=CAM_ASM_000338 /TAXON_ID=268821 /ORGANISM="Scrippsiella Hangoei, Strain SHTV-5" /LENGTH=39 /DNA_ID= /DNA_START= /DNA_END= /DNA_ORIENTATION=
MANRSLAAAGAALSKTGQYTNADVGGVLNVQEAGSILSL